MRINEIKKWFEDELRAEFGERFWDDYGTLKNPVAESKVLEENFFDVDIDEYDCFDSAIGCFFDSWTKEYLTATDDDYLLFGKFAPIGHDDWEALKDIINEKFNYEASFFDLIAYDEVKNILMVDENCRVVTKDGDYIADVEDVSQFLK